MQRVDVVRSSCPIRDHLAGEEFDIEIDHLLVICVGENMEMADERGRRHLRDAAGRILAQRVWDGWNFIRGMLRIGVA